MKTKITVMALMIVGLLSAVVMAQEQTGSLFGMVTTTDGAAIVGAKITVASPALIRPLTTMTNDRGSYVFPALPVGTYSITFEAEKYKSTKRENISLSIGAQLRVNIALETGVVGEEVVTITGEAPLIDVKSSDTGMSISKELFNTLPKGRNFASLVTLAPGANNQQLTGGIEIDGASKAENIWVINGIDVSAMYGGQSTATAVFEFVEEVQVRSGGYDAEFGGSMGGVINVITRSGGNEFHGEGTFYLNNNALDSNSRDTLRLNPLNDQQAEYIRYDKDEYSTYEVGGGLSGYVLKDRIWFFGSYIPNFTDTTRNVKWRDSNDIVTDTEGFDQTIRSHNAAAKVSAQVTDKLRASVSYTTDWNQRKGNLPNLNGHDNQDYDFAAQGQTNPGWNVAANVDYLLSDNLYANVKGGYHKIDTQQIGGVTGPRHLHFGRGISWFADDPAYASVPEQYRVPVGYSEYPYNDGFNTKKNIREKMNWSGDLTFFTEAAGSHMTKGGLQFYRIAQDIDSTYKYDYLRYYWDQDTPYTNISAPGRGKYGYYEIRAGHVNGYGQAANVNSNRYALFVQDSWGVTDRLTLNIGVRSEKENIPSFSDLPEFQQNPIEFGFADKVAPRLGVAYDVWGDGRFKIFGNYAIYYDVMKLNMALGSYGGFKWQSRYMTLDTLEWWTMGGLDPKGTWPRPDMSTRYPGRVIGHRDWRIPSFDTTDPDLLPTAIREFIVGGDYQLADNLALNVRVVHKRLIRTIEDVGTLTPDGEQYYISNPGFGYSVSKLAPGAPPTPKAKRHYTAVELRLLKRLSNNWQGGANLTLSRLSGDYGGLASSDEQGRNSPNVERYYDSWLLNWDANWNPIDGPLPTDRRYVAKIFGSYTFDWGLTLGAYQTLMDGTPHQTAFTMISLQGLYPLNRGDMGRSDMISQTNMYAEYNFNIGEYRAQANINVTNLFDQKIANRIWHFYNRNNPAPKEQTLIDMFHSKTPYNWQGMVPAADVDPRFGMKYAFMGPRVVRLGLKLFF